MSYFRNQIVQTRGYSIPSAGSTAAAPSFSLSTSQHSPATDMKCKNWQEQRSSDWDTCSASHRPWENRRPSNWNSDRRYRQDFFNHTAPADSRAAAPSISLSTSQHSPSPDKRNSRNEQERPQWGHCRQSRAPRAQRHRNKASDRGRYAADSHCRSAAARSNTTDPSTSYSSTTSLFSSPTGMKSNSWGKQKRSGSGNRSQSQSSRGTRRPENWTADRRYEPEGTRRSTPTGTSTAEATTTTTSSVSSAPSSSASQTSQAPELPGFYFDPEKNRYFRLLPGNNNCNPLTTESIKQKEMEVRRLQLLKEDRNRNKTVQNGLNSSLLLRKRKLGLLDPASYCRHVHELKVSCMQKKKIEVHNLDFPLRGDAKCKLLMADSACEKIFTVNKRANGAVKYGILDLKNMRKDCHVEMYDFVYRTSPEVTDMCWASLRHPDSHVVMSFLDTPNDPGVVTVVPVSLFLNSFIDHDVDSLYNVKISPAWCCAWCLNPQANTSVSAGSTNRVIVVNLVTGHRQAFGANSDVLSQKFATREPVLYNGCRSGEIFSVDIRRNLKLGPRSKSISLFHDSAVTSLRILEDENYLMATDMSGAIKLWDLRTLSCVREYKGHHNEYAFLPLNVCEEEGLLVTVGQDCYTRIWNLHDARLLRTIPSPYPTYKDLIPSVVYSSRLGGKHGVPGMLMAVKEDLYYYSYNENSCT